MKVERHLYVVVRDSGDGCYFCEGIFTTEKEAVNAIHEEIKKIEELKYDIFEKSDTFYLGGRDTGSGIGVNVTFGTEGETFSHNFYALISNYND